MTDGLTPRFISSRLRSLGFQLTNRHPADLLWDSQLLKQCRESYGITEPTSTIDESSQHSQSSEETASEQAEESLRSESIEPIESVERQNPGGRVTENTFVEDTLLLPEISSQSAQPSQSSTASQAFRVSHPEEEEQRAQKAPGNGMASPVRCKGCGWGSCLLPKQHGVMGYHHPA